MTSETPPESPAEAPPGTPAGAPAERPGWRRDAVVFLTGQGVSLFGSMLVQYAIMWHLTLTTRSGVVMTMAVLFGFLPQAIVSVFGGVWADRLNRKALIVAADATIALTTLALALFMLGGGETLWVVYLTLAIRSAGAGIQMPAVTALIPQIIPTARLMRINAINATVQSALMLIAPAAAAALYASASIVAIFFLDVVTAVIGIGLLLTIAVPTIRTAASAAVGYFDDLRAGLRYIHGHHFVRWLLGLYAVVMLLVAAPSYLTPLMMVRSFGEEVWRLTALEIAFSVGMMLGGAVLAAWGGLRNRVLTITLATLVIGVLTVGLGLSPTMWVFLGFMFLVGAGVPFFGTTATTVLQETVEPERQGRVFGVLGIVVALAMPLGMAVFGPLADRHTVESLLVVAGAAVIVVAASILVLPAGRRGMVAANVPRAAADAPAPAGAAPDPGGEV